MHRKNHQYSVKNKETYQLHQGFSQHQPDAWRASKVYVDPAMSPFRVKVRCQMRKCGRPILVSHFACVRVYYLNESRQKMNWDWFRI